jgi:hypothetical protein
MNLGVHENHPGPGTNTGGGGYITFYLPAGYQVTDAAYVTASGSDPQGFTPISVKRQNPIALNS